MARRPGKRISKTATLVGSSRYAVVSTDQRRSTTGNTSSHRQGLGWPCLTDVRSQDWLSRLVRSAKRDTVADLTRDFNCGPNVPEHTHCTLLDMGLYSHTPIRVPVLTAVHHQRMQWAHNHRY